MDTGEFYVSVWNNIGNCTDWTALDPAVVSSSLPQPLALHTPSLINHQVSCL